MIKGHKTHHTKFKRVEITLIMISNHSGIKLKVSNKYLQVDRNPQILGRLKQHTSKKHSGVKKISRRIFKYFKLQEYNLSKQWDSTKQCLERRAI